MTPKGAHGRHAAAGGDSDSDDDGIEYLASPPKHMLRVSNEDAPIVVSSDDEGDDEGPDMSFGSSGSGLKRERSSSSGEHGDARNKRRIALSNGGNAAAGPSRRRDVPAAILVDDSDDEEMRTPETPMEFVLPKADYLVPVVLEIIPDADPEWIKEELSRLMDELKTSTSAPGQAAIDHLINEALESGEYPKVGSEPREPEDVPEYTDPNYHRAKRLGPGYEVQSIDMLQTVFPSIPMGHIRAMFEEGGRQLVPAYQILHRQSMAAEKPYKELKKRRGGKGKGRAEEEDEDAVAATVAEDDLSGLLEARRERAYLRELMAKALAKEKDDMEAAAAKEQAEAQHEERKKLAQERGDAIECQCCFDSEAPEDTATCPDGHCFCHGCIRQHAETKLGDQVTDIQCMDGSGCDLSFTDATLSLVLAEKTMSLYHRLKQMKELELADIPGLESCPFCPFAMVIDNPDEKLFQCLNDGCRKVTCRNCRRPGHIPRRCEEVEADRKLDKRHAVEEAMSEALMRKCPKCAKPYVKESGCNKIYCHGCHTMSCYICQQVIKGYDHFDQTPAGGKGPGKCILWDKQENVNEAARITQARDAAAQRILAEAANEGVDLKEDDIRVDAPAPGPANPAIIRRPVDFAPLMERLVADEARLRAMVFPAELGRQPVPRRPRMENAAAEVVLPAAAAHGYIERAIIRHREALRRMPGGGGARGGAPEELLDHARRQLDEARQRLVAPQDIFNPRPGLIGGAHGYHVPAPLHAPPAIFPGLPPRPDVLFPPLPMPYAPPMLNREPQPLLGGAAPFPAPLRDFRAARRRHRRQREGDPAVQAAAPPQPPAAPVAERRDRIEQLLFGDLLEGYRPPHMRRPEGVPRPRDAVGAVPRLRGGHAAQPDAAAGAVAAAPADVHHHRVHRPRAVIEIDPPNLPRRPRPLAERAPLRRQHVDVEDAPYRLYDYRRRPVVELPPRPRQPERAAARRARVAEPEPDSDSDDLALPDFDSDSDDGLAAPRHVRIAEPNVGSGSHAAARRDEPRRRVVQPMVRERAPLPAAQRERLEQLRRVAAEFSP